MKWFLSIPCICSFVLVVAVGGVSCLKYFDYRQVIESPDYRTAFDRVMRYFYRPKLPMFNFITKRIAFDTKNPLHVRHAAIVWLAPEGKEFDDDIASFWDDFYDASTEADKKSIALAIGLHIAISFEGEKADQYACRMTKRGMTFSAPARLDDAQYHALYMLVYKWHDKDSIRYKLNQLIDEITREYDCAAMGDIFGIICGNNGFDVDPDRYPAFSKACDMFLLMEEQENKSLRIEFVDDLEKQGQLPSIIQEMTLWIHSLH